MQGGSGAKNPPWARSNVNSGMTGMNPQLMEASMMSQQGMMPFQQSQAVYNMQAQGGMGMAMGGQMGMNQMGQGQMYPGNVVAYPTPRAMNPAIYQNSQNNQAPSANEQRVFTGTVTKTHNDFGFVDHDVFYQTSVCAKGVIPKVNDRVLVEATYNPNMPFKWNATRVQVLPKSGSNQKQGNQKTSVYNAVPPPINSNKKNLPPRREDRPPRREERKRSRSRSRSRSPSRRDSRARRDSPPRKRPVVREPSPVKYLVRVPRIPLDIKKLDVPGLSQRYTNMYIPSDFFAAHVKWGETFPPHMPFSINNPCSYHVMPKEVENPNPNDAVLEPPDADYRYSAKVMLISMPTLESLYQKCGLTKADEKDKDSKSRSRDSRDSKSALHPTRLIKFLVGQKGKGGENFAIGGPWSPSLDGENPDTDPRVLVKTAIRTCKALTGLDLSSCAQWFRMVEFYYWRESSSGGGKGRLETVVLFLPDVWSAQPSRIEWTNIQERYKAACEAALKRLDAPAEPAPAAATAPATPAKAVAPATAPSDAPADKTIDTNDSGDTSTITIDENEDDEGTPEPTHYSEIDLKTIKVDQLRQELQARNVSSKGLRAQLVSRLSKLLKAEEENEGKSDDVMEVEDESNADGKEAEDNETEQIVEKEKKDGEVKEDKEVKAEKDKKEGEEDKKEVVEVKDEEKKDNKDKEKTEKEKEEAKKKLEKEKKELSSRYELPSAPCLLVHANSAAKGGKFACSVATLSLMLDYRVTDNKEHSFELFVFAELFNEMLMRDFGFYIYKTLYTLPEKVDEKEKEKEKREDKEKSDEVADKKDEKSPEADKQDEKDKDDKKEGKKEDEDKKDEKEKKDDKAAVKKDEKDKKDRKNDKDKKDDKKDDKRDSRRKDRRDRSRSHSSEDRERGGSPRRRSRGVELPADPCLLLALVYFDTTRVGYMHRRDLQSLFMSLGLMLSRSQIKAILEKVCVKDNFTYKSLVQAIKDPSTIVAEAAQNMPLDTTAGATIVEIPPHVAELETMIAQGNRELLPVFDRGAAGGAGCGAAQDISDTGVVTYKSRVIDVGALVAAEARNTALRTKLEEALESTRRALKQARQAAAATQQSERGAVTQLSDVTQHLNAARARITSLTASSKIFHSALKTIQQKVEAVINIKFEEEDVEIVNGPSKTEKETKTEKKEPADKPAVKAEVKAETKEVKEKTSAETKGDVTTSENMDLDDK